MSQEDTFLSNYNSPPIEVEHSKLERYGDSPYKSVCPACGQGLLLVHRDQKTFKLLELDRCTLCAQLVVYKDIEYLT